MPYPTICRTSNARPCNYKIMTSPIAERFFIYFCNVLRYNVTNRYKENIRLRTTNGRPYNSKKEVLSLLEKLYMAYKDDIFRYLVSLTHDSAVAEELLSEVFLSALTSLHRFRGDSSEKTWLISIARNTYFSWLRKKKIDLPLEMLTGVYATDSPLENIISREKLERVMEIIDEMDEKSRITIKMRADGFSYKDISAKLNIAESSARTLEFRAKNKIRNLLTKEGLL